MMLFTALKLKHKKVEKLCSQEVPAYFFLCEVNGQIACSLFFNRHKAKTKFISDFLMG
jgi:hypothetical protein